MTLEFAITLALRYLVVMLFLPFSALDKILNFNGAVAQARAGDSIGRGREARNRRGPLHRDHHAVGYPDGCGRPARRFDLGGLLRDHGVALEAVLEAG